MINIIFNYKLLLRKGLRYLWKDWFTFSWFNGLFIASSKRRWYTLPSYAPRADARISSRISNPSTILTAFGRIAASISSKRVWSAGMSSLLRQENCKCWTKRINIHWDNNKRCYKNMVFTRRKSPSRCRTQYIEYNSQSCKTTSWHSLDMDVKSLTASTNLFTIKDRQWDSAQCANSMLVWFHASSGGTPLRILRSIFSVAKRILL